MKAYIIPEANTVKIALATLCGVLIAWAGMIVYDHLTINPIAQLQHLKHEVALIKAEARPMNINHDSTVNYFFRGERVEEGE